MAQIILIISDKELKTILQNKLVSSYGFDVLTKETVAEAISMLEILPDIALVVCDIMTGKEAAVKKMYDYLEKNKADFSNEIKMVLLSNDKTFYPNCHIVGPQPNHQKLIKHIGFLLGKDSGNLDFFYEPPKELNEAQEESKTTIFQMPILSKPVAQATTKIKFDQLVVEYLPISSKYLLYLPETEMNFSAYTRFKKGNEFEYNKKITEGTILKKEDLDKIILRSGKEIYIEKQEFSMAIDYLNSLIIEKLQNYNLEPLHRVQLNSDSYEILLDVFKKLSFDKSSIEIIKELTKSVDQMANSPDCMELLSIEYQKRKICYGYAHSQISVNLLLAISEKFSWQNDISKNKIILLALLHDLTLRSDRLIKLHHRYSEESKNLTEEEKQIILNHADDAATMIEKMVKSPQELLVLLREHHGVRGGKGLSNILNTTILPVNMAFIVIEEFVAKYLAIIDKNILENKENETIMTKQQIDSILNEMKVKFEKTTYREVTDRLQKFFAYA